MYAYAQKSSDTTCMYMYLYESYMHTCTVYVIVRLIDMYLKKFLHF